MTLITFKSRFEIQNNYMNKNGCQTQYFREINWIRWIRENKPSNRK